MLEETADLMESGAEDGFRIRSYRNAASVIESYPERIEDIVRNPERKVTEVSGIGKGLAAAVEELCARGSFGKRDALLEKYPPTLLELLRIQVLGPKGIALVYLHLKDSNFVDLEHIFYGLNIRDHTRID